jgi:hypothetical protein
LERDVLNRLAKVILEYAALFTMGAADDIAETYIMLRAGCAAPNAHHQPDSHI